MGEWPAVLAEPLIYMGRGLGTVDLHYKFRSTWVAEVPWAAQLVESWGSTGGLGVCFWGNGVVGAGWTSLASLIAMSL